jgi:hypothetical protein
VADQRSDYFRMLEDSDRPRSYLAAQDPEDDRGRWLFEVVEDDGRRVAIKQVEAAPTGVIHRYWCDHLEDEDGFLADQPFGDADQISEVSREEFYGLWDS